MLHNSLLESTGIFSLHIGIWPEAQTTLPRIQYPEQVSLSAFVVRTFCTTIRWPVDPILHHHSASTELADRALCSLYGQLGAVKTGCLMAGRESLSHLHAWGEPGVFWGQYAQPPEVEFCMRKYAQVPGGSIQPKNPLQCLHQAVGSCSRICKTR